MAPSARAAMDAADAARAKKRAEARAAVVAAAREAEEEVPPGKEGHGTAQHIALSLTCLVCVWQQRKKRPCCQEVTRL